MKALLLKRTPSGKRLRVIDQEELTKMVSDGVAKALNKVLFVEVDPTPHTLDTPQEYVTRELKARPPNAVEPLALTVPRKRGRPRKVVDQSVQ